MTTLERFVTLSAARNTMNRAKNCTSGGNIFSPFLSRTRRQSAPQTAIVLALCVSLFFSTFPLALAANAESPNATSTSIASTASSPPDLVPSPIATTDTATSTASSTPAVSPAASSTAPTNGTPLSGIALDIAAARRHIGDHHLSAVIEERLNQFEKTYSADIAQAVPPRLKTPSDAPLPQNNPHPFRSLPADVPVNTKSLSTFTAPPPAIRAHSDASLLSPSAATISGGEIVITQNIKDRAALLNYDPLAILNFVRTTIAFEPYYGSKKGADATLIEHSGNDADQASLMIALLRAGDQNGNNQTLARYRSATIKIDLGTIMDLVGVEDPMVAAKVLGQARIPYTLVVDQAGQPLFFLMEHVYSEAYVEYNEYRGAVQTGTGQKQWISLDATPVATNYFRTANVLADMERAGAFNVQAFYDSYLAGNYGTQKPIEALKSQITSYLAASPAAPKVTYDDILIQEYRQNNNLEIIPRTLPYTIVTDLGAYDRLPDTFRHKVRIKIKNGDTALLDYTAFASDLADREKVVAYAPAQQADKDLLASYPSIYDVAPLSLLNLKPVFKVRGAVVAGGQSADTSITAGTTLTLEMAFLSPVRALTGMITDTTDDTIAKPTLAGNAEAIAINTGKVIPPESLPTQDTSSAEFLPTQKLYRTALNYLDRLEQSHNELSSITGIRFTHVATRAIVFNGINVEYSGSSPYRFTWKGLRIDSSSLVAPYNHFGVDIAKDIKNFTYLFGLEASFDEASIFEDDFPGVSAVSTVKGVRLINQGMIPGVRMVKITSANAGVIDTLRVSDDAKARYYDAIAKGNTVYTPTTPFTYANWTGLLSVTLDKDGFGSYLIGEGLEGGYTIEQWPDGWQNFWRSHLLPGLTAMITSPKNKDVFIQGQDISWSVSYANLLQNWSENISLNTKDSATGVLQLWSGYGTLASVSVVVKARKLGHLYPGFDNLFFKYGAANGIPPDLLKSMAFQESCCIYSDQLKQQIFDPKAYRYEAHKDYDWYSGPSVGAANRIKEHPERHFAIGGTAIHGIVDQGDQVPEKSVYLGWSTHMGGHPNGLDTSGDKDGNLTAQELLDKNPDKYWLKYRIKGSDWNFTAQLLLASSYRILQTLYDTALTRMVAVGIETKHPANDPTERARDAKPIVDLFDPEVSINIGAKYLKLQHDLNNNDWGKALTRYNGSEDYARAVIKKWNNGNGIFKEITE